MLFLLKKQLNQIENNLFFKIFMRLSFITVKYVLNLLIFLIATKKINNSENEESWKKSVLFLTNIIQNSTIRVRLSQSDLAALESMNINLQNNKLSEDKLATSSSIAYTCSDIDNNAEKPNFFNPYNDLFLSNNKSMSSKLKSFDMTQLKGINPIFLNYKNSPKCKALLKRLKQSSLCYRSRHFLKVY
jgi:hypothetical protein